MTVVLLLGLLFLWQAGAAQVNLPESALIPVWTCVQRYRATAMKVAMMTRTRKSWIMSCSAGRSWHRSAQRLRSEMRLQPRQLPWQPTRANQAWGASPLCVISSRIKSSKQGLSCQVGSRGIHHRGQTDPCPCNHAGRGRGSCAACMRQPCQNASGWPSCGCVHACAQRPTLQRWSRRWRPRAGTSNRTGRRWGQHESLPHASLPQPSSVQLSCLVLPACCCCKFLKPSGTHAPERRYQRALKMCSP